MHAKNTDRDMPSAMNTGSARDTMRSCAVFALKCIRSSMTMSSGMNACGVKGADGFERTRRTLRINSSSSGQSKEKDGEKKGTYSKRPGTGVAARPK